MLSATATSTPATSACLANLVAFGCANSTRNVSNTTMERTRHRTSCHDMSDCEDRKNHATVNHAYPKHQTLSGDLRMFDLNSCSITKGNDSTANQTINQSMGG